MFGTGKLISTEIIHRNGVDYEKKTYDNAGAISTTERAVTKSSYDRVIDRVREQLELLESLQEACQE